MTVQLSMLGGAGAQFFDNSGKPLTGGKLFSYQAGTTTPAATYTTSAGNVAHANPIVLDSAGRVPSGGEIWLLDTTSYKFVLKDSADVLIGTYDNVTGNSGGISSPTGAALVGYSVGLTNAVPTTVQAALRREVWVEDFLPANFNYAVDDAWQYITNAIATGAARIMFGAFTYRISKPVQIINGGIELIGKGSGATILLKTTTTVGTGSNVSRSGTVTDSYAKNAVLIITHPDNEYAYDTTIKGMGFHSNGYIVEYGIYAPRTTHTIMEDVQIYQCKYGWYTNDSWFTTFTKVIANPNSVEANGVPTVAPVSYGWTGSIGFWWADDGTGGPTGTTLNAEQCWARDCSIGWYMYGLDYSAMNACGADNITDRSYFFILSRVTMNGCGSERVKLASFGVISNLNSRLTINTFRSFNINGTAGCAMLFLDDNASTTINNSTFDNFATLNGVSNFVIQNSSKLVTSGSSFPTNGNGFISYSGGSTWTDLGDPIVMRNTVGTEYIGNQLKKVSKAISSGGTVIATFTAAGVAGTEMATIRLKLNWYDTPFPAGMGASDVQVIVYKEGANYRQTVNASVNVAGGNGLTGVPAYSLSRVGNVWSLIMTPVDGDCTVTAIYADIDNYGGITVEFP